MSGTAHTVLERCCAREQRRCTREQCRMCEWLCRSVCRRGRCAAVACRSCGCRRTRAAPVSPCCCGSGSGSGCEYCGGDCARICARTGGRACGSTTGCRSCSAVAVGHGLGRHRGCTDTGWRCSRFAVAVQVGCTACVAAPVAVSMNLQCTFRTTPAVTNLRQLCASFTCATRGESSSAGRHQQPSPW